MAEAVLSSLLGKASGELFSTVLNEFKLLQGVKEEVEELESKLQMIRCMLRTADERQLKDGINRHFLEKLKDAVYDLEDLLDSFRVEALRRKSETLDGMQKKVQDFFSPSNPLLFHCKMAHKIQALKERLDEILKEQKDFNLAGLLGVHIPPPPVSKSRETDSYVIEEDVCGRLRDKAEIIHALINTGNERNVSVIPIVAIGGMGKSTLAKLIYNDPSVATHFNELRIWVYVSEKFDVKKLLNEILLQCARCNNNTSGQASMEPSQTSDQLSMELLQKQLRRALEDKKYLLVLDDVWNEDREKWLELEPRLRCGAVGSKILVTTRSDKVASIMGTLPRYDLEKLSESDCLSLFKKLAFGDKQEQPNLISIGKEIVKKCGGVPLLVRALGSSLYSEESPSKWELVRDSDIWTLQGEDNIAVAALRLSYDSLMPISLKECFTYCASFPKGWEFVADDLIKQWIAQGFIQSSKGNGLLEEEGEEYFKKLCSKSFFQDVRKIISNNCEVTFCRMHAFAHDLALSVAGNEFALSVAGNEFALSVAPNHPNQTATRHLFIDEVKLKDLFDKEVKLKSTKAIENFDKMRSIFAFFNPDYLERNVVSEANVCFKFWRLRVLDISYSWINYLPKSVGKLKHLRYLDLSYTYIEELPKTIYNLFNLQTLKLQSTRIRNLPDDIKRMIGLRHIEFSDVQMPKGIGELASLRTLPRFIVDENSGCGMKVLKNLNLLTGHLSIERLATIENAQYAREASLREKKYLHSLELSFSARFCRDAGDTQEGIQENVIQDLEPHSSLKRLKIVCYMGRKFPTWMERINLVKLELNNCHRCQHLPQLEQLHSLESLNLFGMDAIEYIVEFDKGHGNKSIFPSLKQLDIRNLPNLKGWSIVGADVVGPSEPHDQLFRHLCSLSVDNCPNLTSFPVGLTALEVLRMSNVGCSKLDISSSLSKLRELKLRNMPNLEGLTSQQTTSNDGKAKEVEAHLFIPGPSTLKISGCPKLTYLLHVGVELPCATGLTA